MPSEATGLKGHIQTGRLSCRVSNTDALDLEKESQGRLAGACLSVGLRPRALP